MKGITMLAWGALAGASVLARADVTYTYTGAYFANPVGPYTAGDRVTGTITLAAPLLPGIDEEMIDPVAFRFTDGVQTLTKQSAMSFYFDVGTYPTADPTNAGLDYLNIGLYAGKSYDPENVGEPWYTGIDVYFDHRAGDPSFGYDDASAAVDERVATDGPGVLSLAGSSAAVTPEPGSFALLGTGLAGLAGLLGRGRR